MHEKYTMKNVINCREPREFIQKIIRSAKNANFIQTKIHFEFELWYDFRCSDNVSVFSSYFTNMDDYKHVWWVYLNNYKQFNVNNQIF